MSKASPKRPMSPDEIEAAKMLQGVTFPVASWDKRASASLAFCITPPPAPKCTCNEVNNLFDGAGHFSGCPTLEPPWVPMIGEKMVPQLWRLVNRYRRQIRHPERLKYIRMAELLQAPDFRKRQAGMKILAQREKDRERYAKAMQAKQQPQTTPA